MPLLIAKEINETTKYCSIITRQSNKEIIFDSSPNFAKDFSNIE